MDYNVLLAEAIALLKEAMLHEKECDAKLKKTEEGKHRERLPLIRREYDAVFNKRIQGLQMLNYFRVMTKSEERREYAARLLEDGMADCKDLRDKQMNTLLPAESVLDVAAGSESHVVVGNDGKRRVVTIRRRDGQPDAILVMKDGYQRFGPPIVGIGSDAVEVLKAGKTLSSEVSLELGEYQLTIINTAESAPDVEADIECEDPFTHGRTRYRKTLGGGCAWCRSFGVPTPKAELRIRLSSTGVFRDAKIRVELSRITKLQKDESSGGGGNSTSAGAAAGGSSSYGAATNGSSDTQEPQIPPPDGAYPSIAPGRVDLDAIAQEIDAMRRAPVNTVQPVDGYVVGVPPHQEQHAAHRGTAGVVPTYAPAGATTSQTPYGGASSSASAAVYPYSSGAAAVAGDARGAPALLPLTTNMSPLDRLREIEKRTWSWYDEPPVGYGAPQFYGNESVDNRQVLAAVTNMVEPTPIE